MNLGDYSAVVISISGGKDSQTIMGVVMQMVREQSYGNGERTTGGRAALGQERDRKGDSKDNVTWQPS